MGFYYDLIFWSLETYGDHAIRCRDPLMRVARYCILDFVYFMLYDDEKERRFLAKDLDDLRDNVRHPACRRQDSSFLLAQLGDHHTDASVFAERRLVLQQWCRVHCLPIRYAYFIDECFTN